MNTMDFAAQYAWIYCARSGGYQWAVRYGEIWRCSWCGARVKVVA